MIVPDLKAPEPPQNKALPPAGKGGSQSQNPGPGSANPQPKTQTGGASKGP